jgi:hypothetical protein
MSTFRPAPEVQKRADAARTAYEKATNLRRQLQSGYTAPELGFPNMTPQEAISSEWLTSYKEAGGDETKFFEDAVACLRRLRIGVRIKALHEATQRDDAGFALEGIDWVDSLWPTSRSSKEKSFLP